MTPLMAFGMPDDLFVGVALVAMAGFAVVGVAMIFGGGTVGSSAAGSFDMHERRERLNESQLENDFSPEYIKLFNSHLDYGVWPPLTPGGCEEEAQVARTFMDVVLSKGVNNPSASPADRKVYTLVHRALAVAILYFDSGDGGRGRYVFNWAAGIASGL